MTRRERERIGKAVGVCIVAMLKQTQRQNPSLSQEQAEAVVVRWLQEHGGIFGDIEATARYVVEGPQP